MSEHQIILAVHFEKDNTGPSTLSHWLRGSARFSSVSFSVQPWDWRLFHKRLWNIWKFSVLSCSIWWINVWFYSLTKLLLEGRPSICFPMDSLFTHVTRLSRQLATHWTCQVSGFTTCYLLWRQNIQRAAEKITLLHFQEALKHFLVVSISTCFVLHKFLVLVSTYRKVTWQRETKLTNF